MYNNSFKLLKLKLIGKNWKIGINDNYPKIQDLSVIKTKPRRFMKFFHLKKINISKYK